MSGRGGDRGSPGRGAKRKGPPRVSAGGGNAETYVETGAQALTVPQDLEELYVDDRLPKKGKGKKNGHNGAAPEQKAANGKAANGKAANGKAANGKAANGKEANGRAASAKAASPKAAPSSSSAKKQGHRAAERRRARGQVPIGPEAGTSTALNQQQQNARGGESGHLKYATGVLTCVQGPEEGLALNLLEGSYTVGRGRDNSFVLKDIASSRRHLRIDVEGGRVTVTDMGSGNGTRLNGKTTHMFVLEEGDRVELGNSVLVFSRVGGKGESRSAPVSDPAIEDAQARIERAAEQLAAELGDRFRDPEDVGVEDSDAAPTATGRPRSKGKHDDEEDERSKRKTRPPMPEELWNDALTQVPLSDVVPADSPLGPKESSGPPRQARVTPRGERAPPPPPRSPPRAPPTPPPRELHFDDEPPPPPTASPALTSPPLPLPPRVPATMPPQPAARRPAVNPYGVVADKQTAPAWTYVVLPALVVVLVLGTALGGWALYRYVKGSGAMSTAASPKHEESVRLALEALAKDDVATALRHAERAYEIRPDDVTVVALLKTIQDRQVASENGRDDDDDGAAPSPSGTKATANGETPPGAGTAKAAADPAPVESAPAETAPADKAPTESEPVVVESAAVDKSPPPSAAAPAAEKKVEKAAPAPAVKRAKASKPKPKPRRQRQQRRGMSDDDAGQLYRQAVRLVRDEDEAKGCTLLRKVAKEAPQGSNWKVKANAAVGRYGCD